MGFMDKAKKMAEQAQAKLDEAQKQFNSPPAAGSGGPSQGGPAVEYDQHGRPIPSSEPPPPHGDPLAGPPSAAAPPPPPAAAEPKPPSPEPAAQDDPGNPSYAPPKLSSGDPLG